MNKQSFLLLAAVTAAALSTYSHAATFTIGDNDGYGMGIADGESAPFTVQLNTYDGRSESEKTNVDGAQFTDTYPTTFPGLSPQDGTLATFTFDKVGSNLTFGSLKVDMAGFEASRYGEVLVNFNGITQDWAFDDGLSTTKVRNFDLSQAVLESINSFGQLIITVDSKQSKDFYGFDFLELTVENGVQVVPIPGAIWLFGTGLAGLLGLARKRKA